ncbi:Exodeoxyribonuclease VII large subunit [hydrothermal vent metagenome]|uniref:Exodeoxyribonuclease VII large subunit n=1 Tax=hydrothermal vent metagenome TaxID=652676 RepID=A0A1W1EED2_9ZZZZ
MSQMMSVTSLNTKIKSLLEATFMHILVEGEVASVTYHTSGHVYFSIKDKESSIKCVMWRSSAAKMKFRIEKGMHIVIEGSLGVYTPRGEYQFYAVKVEPYGQGALALAFEQLKEKLKNNGYFDAQRKKSIPKQIKKIALVTAKDSAALHDMLKIIEKRWAMVEVVIVDTLVQGDEAASQIVRSLKYADSIGADVVVFGRGGGSTEDLWPFNEEIVADAIFSMNTATVSAVGHEVDVLISDFVADLRAPTPSAAIEMILQDSKEILYTLNELSQRFTHILNQILHKKREALRHMEEMLFRSSPSRKLLESKSEFRRLEDEFKRVMNYKLSSYENQLPTIKNNFINNMKFVINNKEQELEYISKKIVLSNPKLLCKRGWAKVSLNGKIIVLDDLKEQNMFTLEDSTVKIEAICLEKKFIN